MSLPLYGEVVSFQPLPDGSGFAELKYIEAVPGSHYDMQISSDGGVTWTTVGNYNPPPSIPPQYAKVSNALQVPGGVPFRLMPK